MTDTPSHPPDTEPDAQAIHNHFAAMAAALENGTYDPDMDDQLDVLLGTAMPERDREAEAAWEGGVVDGDLHTVDEDSGLLNPPRDGNYPPRYDDVFAEGVAWLDTL